MTALSILTLLSNRWWTGAAEPALALAQGLLQRGHRVVLGAPAGSQVEEVARRYGIPLLEGLHLDPHFHPWAWQRDLRRLRAFLRRAHVDVLHSHLSHDHWLAAGALALVRHTARRPMVHVRSVHALRRCARGLDRWLLRRGADHLITASSALRRDLIAGLGVPAERVTVIPGAVDTQRFRPDVSGMAVREEFGLAPHTPLAGIVARLAPSRGHLLLVEAFARVHAALPEARLAIVGKGEFRPQIEQRVRQLGLAEAVIFAGYRGADLPAVLAALQVFVLLAPGSEGSCRAALEAMAAGKAVVAARVGALADIVVDGETGLLVEPDAPAALAHAIGRLLRAPDQAQHMGARGRLRVERDFSRQRQVDQVLRLYDWLCNARPAPPADDRGLDP
jgi:glycosyltransferase involved in cell wall biosynthesis